MQVMQMKGEEALKALFENKTVIADWGDTYRMKNGVLMFRHWDTDSFQPSTITINNFLGALFEVQEEYHLTFQQALKAMLDGKVVKCETSKCHLWRISEKGLEIALAVEDLEWTSMYMISSYDQKAKWKVIE